MSVFLSEVDSSCPFVPSLNGPKGPPPVYVDDWQEFYDKKQQHAYFNSKSRGQSLWVRPTQDDITKELKAATDILNQQNGEQSTINDEWRGKYISLLDELIDYLDSSIQSQSQSVEEQTRSVSGISINGGEVKENVQSFEGFLTKQGGGTSFVGFFLYFFSYFCNFVYNFTIFVCICSLGANRTSGGISFLRMESCLIGNQNQNGFLGDLLSRVQTLSYGNICSNLMKIIGWASIWTPNNLWVVVGILFVFQLMISLCGLAI
eukprot:TRINITY_DN8670_c0_g1_i3.p1 TRINITY_DN8670_c0_g1~~TRINITY_DN8670_c0_g1_i3.p1  ORF type:complete len:262 (-),score=3.19 TRINITY_DN8670_c0_g1_i3:440-1225(-)